ncbi:general amino acid permease AGP2 [Aspergillus sclerotioniger CBS 115572]|uniref:General amino acid permease AGP2 n=1 Tax=Aspergillus sclerotioniger CBS 115572 TaxID=1450535 RepID=A0A317X5C9_9EURO|nr:general amino acid permease AGP2 [Aspergillus sclerotioniger CBS 115572]PWY93806.1 general amino acid permease AGP2 [Aspergillus sclerotioniger CBS 115572]
MAFTTAIHNGDQSPTISRHGVEAEEYKGHSTVLPEKDTVVGDDEEIIGDGVKRLAFDHTHRKLKPRHIQLIGIGGTIGTVLYVQIGKALMEGGPASLFLAFVIWSVVILCITVCLAEMVTYLPISSPFIRFASRYVDEAFGVAAGYNFFIFEAALVPFEVTACNLIINYWSDAVPVAGIIVIVLVLFSLLNIFAVKWYGEAEFWLSMSKVVLSVGLIFFTFIVMLGGNPKGDRFGFRYWNNPGSFAEYYKTGDLGRWLGFLACLIQASFTIAGPDYVSMAAGEAMNPRGVLPRAYNGIFYRITAFFVLGVLCVGILVPYNDPVMAAAFEQDLPGAAASPYVVAMDRLQIPVLPHIVNAVVLLAAFSAGNSYVYCASRSLYGLALDGKAPRILTTCTKAGVPVYCVMIVLLIALLSFLQVSNGSAVVLNWFVNLVTASQLINFSVITFTYTRFRKALMAQGVPRQSLPYRSRGQPYVAYIALVSTFIMTFVGGYTVFLPGNWDIPTFFFSYTMIGVFPIIYIGWKFWHRTKFLSPEEIDIFTGVDEVEQYTRNYVEVPSSNPFTRFNDWLFG